MLVSINEAVKAIKENKYIAFAGDEELLKQLPSGNWIGGTIPYFIDEDGGRQTKEKIFMSVMPDVIKSGKAAEYAAGDLSSIPKDAPENGFSIIIIPAASEVHQIYAKKAPDFENIFLRPIIGWIAGVDLADLGKITPKVINGGSGELSENKAVVLHLALPPEKIAAIGIVNLFRQGKGDVLTFEKEGFSADACLAGGKPANLAEYITERKIDTKLPLVANYSGAMVNVSIQAVKAEEKRVDFYAPVFRGVEYKFAAPVESYVRDFNRLIPSGSINAVFSCNCILNYLYSELEGKKTGNLTGPITFGEIAYQLLNQTLVYLEIKSI